MYLAHGGLKVFPESLIIKTGLSLKQTVLYMQLNRLKNYSTTLEKYKELKLFTGTK